MIERIASLSRPRCGSHFGSALAAILVAAGCIVAPSSAETAVVSAIDDNTLYESSTGSLSNGRGIYMFAGRGGATNPRRRAVLNFNVAAAIPAGSTINSARLRLHMSQTQSGAIDVKLHRLTKSWGESNSNAPGEEDAGAPSLTNDATWIHTFYNTQFWTNPGGDFNATVSATTSVSAVGFYDWGTNSQLVVDVQNMLNNPAQNFGWILIGNETTAQSYKRFDTRENPNGANRPQLIIDYSPAGTCAPDFTDAAGTGPDGVVNVFDLFVLLSNWNSNGAGAALAEPNNVVNVFDLFVLLSAWGDC